MIGKLRDRVVLQEEVLTPDDAGGFTSEWQDIEDVTEVYAYILPVSAGEQLRFHKLEARATHRIIIRYRTDITTAHRVIKDDQAFEIISVANRGNKKAYLDILAVEKQN